MRDLKDKRGGDETKLASLMQTAVETRNRLTRARERLRSIEERLRGKEKKDYESQRMRALSEYIEAMEKARRARTRLLKHLHERAA